MTPSLIKHYEKCYFSKLQFNIREWQENEYLTAWPMITLFYTLIFNVVTKCKETMLYEFMDGILQFCWCRCSVIIPTLNSYLKQKFFLQAFLLKFCVYYP